MDWRFSCLIKAWQSWPCHLLLNTKQALSKGTLSFAYGMLLLTNRYALRWEYCTPCRGWNYLLRDSWWNFFIRTGLISLCEFHCLFSSQIADRGWFCWFLNMLTYQPALHGGDASSPSFCFARRRITFVPLNLAPAHIFVHQQVTCMPSSRLSMMNSEIILPSE